MALPPTIPTSFVPHSAASERRFRADFSGAFDFFAYAVLVAVFALAAAVFFYGRILDSSKAAKDAELASAQQSIDPATAENFVRLRNRLASSGVLLEKHISFSSFFSSLEKILLTTVRFTSLRLSISDTGAAKMEGLGVAKSFNALAAASSALSKDGHIKDAIFSNIRVNKDGSVSFALSAALDQKIVAFSPPPAAAPLPSVAEPSSATTTAP